jgi:hypothetical protein
MVAEGWLQNHPLLFRTRERETGQVFENLTGLSNHRDFTGAASRIPAELE